MSGSITPERGQQTDHKGRSERRALLLIWGIIGLIGLAVSFYGWIKLRESRVSVDWPVTTGKIVTSKVETHWDEDGVTYSATIEYVYTVDGVRHSSDIVVIGGHEYGAHGVARRYPLGKTVSVSYDPDDVTHTTLEPGVESYLFQKWGLSATVGAMFMAAIFNTLLRVVAKEERSLLDRMVILPFMGLYWSLVLGVSHPFILAGLVTAAGYLSTLDLRGAEYGFATFAAFFGLVLVFALWFKFLGWLSGLAEKK